MNMVIIKQVHHLIIEKEGESLQTVTKRTPIDTNQAYPIL